MVSDASIFYHFCRRTLGVAPKNIYILSDDDESREIIFDSDEQEIEQIEQDETSDELEAAKINPFGSGVIKEHYCPYTKAKFNILYNYLTDEEKRVAKDLQQP